MKYDQAIIVAGCAMTSFMTIGWMVNDIHLREKDVLRKKYETTIEQLKQEIVELKVNKSNTLNLK